MSGDVTRWLNGHSWSPCPTCAGRVTVETEHRDCSTFVCANCQATWTDWMTGER